jgi:phage terminase large subunit GpA-like protein
MKQLASEKMVTHVRGGRSYRVYEKVGPNVRNEALDVRCYAVVARAILNPNYEAIATPPPAARRARRPRGRTDRAERHRAHTTDDAAGRECSSDAAKRF